MGIESTKSVRRYQAATVAGCFQECLRNSTVMREPFPYWLLERPLPDTVVDRIVSLPFDPPQHSKFDGRREDNNSTRVYFSPENQMRFSVCREVAEAFSNPEVIQDIENLTATDLSRGKLRIEYCQDVDGFWLEPHLDISVKLFTMLIYLSDDPDLFDAGTDIYDDTPQHRLIATAPYERNKGLIFIPGTKSWHGFSKRTIHGVRKSIIINYVSDEWKNRDELSEY